jgi:glycosyltransferase involved in cell wall biosynthesis
MISMHVIVSGRNNEKYVGKCLRSIFDQDYERFRVTVIDDASDDASWAVYSSLEDDGWEFDLVENEQRKGALENYVTHARWTADGEIVVCIDGDDWLPHHGVLSRVAEEFEKGAWFVYGKFATTVPRPEGWATGEYSPDRVLDIYWRTMGFVPDCDFRRQGCKTAGLRAFRSELIKKIADEDLMLGGWWQQTGWDNALVFPMLEMSGLDRISYIEDTIYIYNITERSDGACPEYQAICEFYSRFQRKRYRRLDKIESLPERYVKEDLSTRAACIFIEGIHGATFCRAQIDHSGHLHITL